MPRSVTTDEAGNQASCAGVRRRGRIAARFLLRSALIHTREFFSGREYLTDQGVELADNNAKRTTRNAVGFSFTYPTVSLFMID